jgi:hypothetical protein
VRKPSIDFIMKIFLFLSFIFQSVFAFSQNPEKTLPVVINPHTYGYVNGIRLDSIDAEYGQVITRMQTIAFDYGQRGGRKKLTVTDDKGTALVFARDGLPFLLNFFFYNGWELDHTYHDATEKYEIFILKKRR